jgi:hypothetical protein
MLKKVCGLVALAVLSMPTQGGSEVQSINPDQLIKQKDEEIEFYKNQTKFYQGMFERSTKDNDKMIDLYQGIISLQDDIIRELSRKDRLFFQEDTKQRV